VLVDVRLGFFRISLRRHDPPPVELGIEAGEKLPPEPDEIRMGPERGELRRIGLELPREVGRQRWSGSE
jgi:hypothetical protein